MALAVAPVGLWRAMPCPTPGCDRRQLFRARSAGGATEIEIKCDRCKQIVVIPVR